ncbi:hypothetical protein FPRO05_03099 [Fusarium proliferatum]|uniref:Uncharacterized protein n=1 Tax=Gibberella intermedia TaxID=948311 RepID=A0A365N0H8_GIBIN|nr:hypothetical protein FPRO05_03099 [Fusarium proliferatum]
MEHSTIADTNESILYERQFSRLRTTIIERDDTVTLEKYLKNAPWAVKTGRALGMYYDPFIVAARPGSLDGRCCRVLNTAAHCGHLEWAGADLIRRLIESGADPHVKIMEDKEFTVRTDVTIISTASRCANVDTLKVLLECASKVVSKVEDPREVTAEFMEEKVQRVVTVLGLLLECSPETINTQDQYGNTPLRYAAKNYSNYGQEHTAVFQYLCDRGADSCMLNKNGETALHSSCSCDGGLPVDTAAIETLLDHGAKFTDTDNDGDTPLHLAVKNLENIEVITSLLDHGADIRVKNLKGNTPLHEAASGMFWPGVVEEKYKSMGDILRRLQGDGGYLMDELNEEGQSPRQIQNGRRKDFREKVDDVENERKRWGF